MDKRDMAVKRIQEASAMSLHYYKKPLLLTYSGGKDSDAVLEVAKIAGIPFEVRHSHTTADAPETVRHVREKFRALELEGVHCGISWPMYKGRRVSMWTLIPQEMVPPTRCGRYCCRILKETGGRGRFIATGVRWAESVRRKGTRGLLENVTPKINDRVVVTNDNDDRRRLVESCAKLGSHIANPIIDWDDSDVWGLLRDRKVQCNPLYGEFSRVGCIGCSMAGKRVRERGFLRWPKYKAMYIRAFDRMLAVRRSRGKNWKGRDGAGRPTTSSTGGWSTTSCPDRSTYWRKTMTDKHIDILRNARDNHSNGTYQKALDAAIEAMEEVERLRAGRNDTQPLTKGGHAMNREILFRGKCLHDGKWVVGDLSNVVHDSYEVDPATVGQYTGLKDKNGKRIFEGDVVEAKRICNQESWTGFVVWWNGCFAIQDAKTRNVPAIDLFDNYEIVGNIHDNPELLEGDGAE